MVEEKNSYWLVNGKLLSEQEKRAAREKLRSWAKEKTEEELYEMLWSRRKYEKYWSELCSALKVNLPESYQGLIATLNWDYSISQDWDYVIWLLASDAKWHEIWKHIADKRMSVQKHRESLNWDKIREIYWGLSEELRERFFKKEIDYSAQIDEIREYFWDWMWSTFDWLIPLLWWDKDRWRWAKYVRALMKSPEEWENFLKSYSKHKDELAKKKKELAKKKAKLRRQSKNNKYAYN